MLGSSLVGKMALGVAADLAGPMVRALLSEVADGKTKPEDAAKVLAQQGEISATRVVEEHAEKSTSLERLKGSVRPQLMRGSNFGLFSVIGVHIFHALGQAVGAIDHGSVPQETWDRLFNVALLCAGISGAGYGVRSAERHRGKA